MNKLFISMECFGEAYLLDFSYKFSLFIHPGLNEYVFKSRFALIWFLLFHWKL